MCYVMLFYPIFYVAKESGNLYKVTLKLLNIFFDSTDIDGIIYVSVKSEGAPVVALKSSTVDANMNHQSCDCYRISNVYGYAQYSVLHTHIGDIQNNNSIVWSEKPSKGIKSDALYLALLAWSSVGW